MYARALRTGQSRLFGVLVRNLQNPYFLDVIGGLQEAAAAVDAGVVVADSNYSAEHEAAHIEVLAGQRIDGLAIAPVGSGAVIRRWQGLRPGLHTVVINATAPGLDGVSRVSPDNVAAVTLAAEHLASEDKICVDHETLRRWMLADGLWSRARKRSPHRRRRERKAHFGELVQLDGSFHDWFEGRGPQSCLLTLVDDATGRSLGRFSAQETIWAAVAVLRRLRDPDVYARLEETAALLEAGLRHEDVTVQRVGSMLTPFFRRGPVRNLADAQAADRDRYAAFFRHLLARGVYVAPSPFEALFVSTAHGPAEVERTVEAAQEFLAD